MCWKWTNISQPFRDVNMCKYARLWLVSQPVQFLKAVVRMDSTNPFLKQVLTSSACWDFRNSSSGSKCCKTLNLVWTVTLKVYLQPYCLKLQQLLNIDNAKWPAECNLKCLTKWIEWTYSVLVNYKWSTSLLSFEKEFEMSGYALWLLIQFCVKLLCEWTGAEFLRIPTNSSAGIVIPIYTDETLLRLKTRNV